MRRTIGQYIAHPGTMSVEETWEHHTLSQYRASHTTHINCTIRQVSSTSAAPYTSTGHRARHARRLIAAHTSPSNPGICISSTTLVAPYARSVPDNT
eukprot:1306280-Rhodomonas_salina.1